MMEQVLNYNIHDILKLQIVRDKKYGFRDLINLKFSPFQVNKIDKPDITLNIGKFTLANSDCYLVDYKYHVKKNYLYCRDSEGKASWEVEIKGLEEGDTIINFNVNNKLGLQPFINPDFIPQILLLRMLEYKLSQKGYFLIHSAGVNREGKAYLLCGRGGSFKTTLCMDLVRHAGFSLLGDDRVILHQDKAFSFMAGSAANLFSFMVEHLATENSWSFSNRIGYLRALRSGSLKPENYLTDLAELKAMFFIVRGLATSEAFCQPISNEKLNQVVARIIADNKLEDFVQLKSFGINSAPFLKYMLAYSFVFPHSLIATYEKQVAESLRLLLNGVPVYQLDIPHKYYPNLWEQVAQLIG